MSGIRRAASGVVPALVASAMTASVAGQAAAAYDVVTSTGTPVTRAALVADVADVDVVLVGERAPATSTAGIERALLTAFADGRPAIALVIGTLDSSAQEPVEHFLMGHMTFAELASETRMPSALATAARPILDLALARSWPVRAAGTFGATEDRGGALADAVASAHELGRPARTLVVALFDARGISAFGEIRDAIRDRTPDVRIRSIVVAPAMSVSPGPGRAAPDRAAPDYVAFPANR